MLKEYKTLLGKGFAEISIEKSKFLGYATPVASEKEALSFIAQIKAKHPDATHNVSAYTTGLNNDIQKYNDDGEPSGTAGIPVLEIIKKEDLRNVAIVITRYFGGIKLGGGGLVRAYTKGAKIAIEASQIVTKRLFQVYEVVFDYTMLGKVQNDILQSGYLIKEIQYDHLVHLYIYVSVERLEAFKKQIIDLTNGRCEIYEKEQKFLTD